MLRLQGVNYLLTVVVEQYFVIASNGVFMWLRCVIHFVQIFPCKCFNMVPKDISQEKKACILATRETVRHTGQSKPSVNFLVSAAQGLPPNIIPPSKHSSGCPSKIFKAKLKLLRGEVLKQPTVTSVKVKKSHPKLLGNIAMCTTQEHLQKMLNVTSRVAVKNLLLMPAVIKKRLAFANKYQNWTKKVSGSS